MLNYNLGLRCVDLKKNCLFWYFKIYIRWLITIVGVEVSNRSKNWILIKGLFWNTTETEKQNLIHWEQPASQPAPEVLWYKKRRKEIKLTAFYFHTIIVILQEIKVFVQFFILTQENLSLKKKLIDSRGIINKCHNLLLISLRIVFG